MTASRVVKYIRDVRWLFPASIVILALLSVGTATSHDSGTAQSLEEARVFHFYSTWYRIPDRTFSCCNMNDCHTVEIRREGEQYFFLDNVYTHSWRLIPPARLEHNAKDPRESPDGSSHVCFIASNVYCAVLGSGQ